MTWTHAGIEIETTADGKFRAIVDGMVVKKPSLAALKSFIDRTVKFVAFTAFDGLSKKLVKVTGVIKSQRRFGSNKWRTSAGERNSVAENTPANMTLINNYIALDQEADDSRDKYQERLEKLRLRIKFLEPT